MSRKTNRLRKRVRQWERRERNLRKLENLALDNMARASDQTARAMKLSIDAHEAVEELRRHAALTISVPEPIPARPDVMMLPVVFSPECFRRSFISRAQTGAPELLDVQAYCHRVADEARTQIANALIDYIAKGKS